MAKKNPIGNEPLDWMKRYLKKYGDFKVAVSMSNYWKHFVYESDEFYDFFEVIPDMQPNHREVFKDEVVIETDMEHRTDNKKAADKIKKRLRELGFNFTMFYSGNKSYHFHVFFPELLEFDKEKCKVIKERIIRKILWCPRKRKWFCNSCDGLVDSNDKSKGHCFVQNKKVDLQVTGNHLIRLEYGVHMKTDRRKVLITYDCGEPNKVPKELIEFADYIEIKREQWKPVASSDLLHTDRNCIKFFLSDNFSKTKDGRVRVAFILINILKNEGYGYEKVLTKALHWNKMTLNNYHTKESIIAKVGSAFKSDKCPGCSYTRQLLKELGQTRICKGCSKDKFHKNRREDKDGISNTNKTN